MQKRKNYLIKKKFQFNFLFQFILLLLAESVFIVGFFLYLSHNTLTTSYVHSTLRIQNTQDFFFVPYGIMTLIVVGGISLIGMVVFILLSHRIAGPLYRFEKILNQMAGGDLTAPVDLRRNDQLTEIKTALSVLRDSLEQRLRAVKKEATGIESVLNQKQAPEAVAECKEKIRRIIHDIDSFKLSSDPKEQ